MGKKWWWYDNDDNDFGYCYWFFSLVMNFWSVGVVLKVIVLCSPLRLLKKKPYSLILLFYSNFNFFVYCPIVTVLYDISLFSAPNWNEWFQICSENIIMNAKYKNYAWNTMRLAFLLISNLLKSVLFWFPGWNKNYG